MAVGPEKEINEKFLYKFILNSNSVFKPVFREFS